MTIPYGGETPLIGAEGLLTVEAPDGTSLTQLVLPGELYKLAVAANTAGDGSAYKLVATAQHDDSSNCWLVQALQRKQDVNNMTVLWLRPGSGLVRQLNYKSGSAPTLGQSVECSSDLKTVVGVSVDAAKGLVLSVDPGTLTCEVLF